MPDPHGGASLPLARPRPAPAACPALDGVRLEPLRAGTRLGAAGHRLVLVTAGGVCVCRGSTATRVDAGELLHLRPGAAGGDLCRTDAAAGWILTVGEGCGQVASECDPAACAPAWAAHEHVGRALPASSPTPLAIDDVAWWRREVDALAAELLGDRPGREVAVRARSELLLVAATRLTAEARPQAPAASAAVAAALDVIDARYAESIGLREVAAEVDRSPAYLTDLVRRETGRSVGTWIRDRRLSAARRLLRETSLPVAEVGARVGYADPTHFARVFRREHGHSPSQWRGQDESRDRA